MTNRLRGHLHTVTRWPDRPSQRARLARVTVDYIAALEAIYRDEPEIAAVHDALTPLFEAALGHLSLSAELGGEA